MLRPEITIKIFKYGTEKSAVNDQDFFKYTIQPADVKVTENRQGISCEFSTKHSKYDVTEGDRLLLDMKYANVPLSKTREPILVIQSVNIKSDRTLMIKAIDEFSYIAQTTNFVPLNPSKEQQRFLAENMSINYKGYTPAFKKITIEQMLGYIQSLVLPKTFYWGDGDYEEKVDYVNKRAFTSTIDLKANIGKWEPLGEPSLAAVVQRLKQNYFYNIFQFASSVNATQGSDESELEINDFSNTVLAKTSILVTGLSACSPYASTQHQFQFVDDFNIISEDLIYSSPKVNGRGVHGVFRSKKTKTEPNPTTDNLYAYFDNDSTVKVSDSLGIVKGYAKYLDTLTINDAASISDEDREKYVKNKLLSTNYTGFTGGFSTFNMNMNIYDRVQMIFNNFDRRNELSKEDLNDAEYGINEISRTYSSGGGLTMSVSLRQQLKFSSDNEWINFNE